MIRSMTGFGRGEAPLGRGTISVEVRTVNERHLEVRPRLPREFTAFEQVVRDLVAAQFGRGHVEVSVRLPPQGLRRR